jgi:non-heme chloroperoxidase
VHKTTASDGVALSYRSFGDGPTTVILVHGWMMSGAVYDDLVTALGTNGLRLLVPDLRGTGGSGSPDSGYTIEQYARDVIAVADAASARSFVIVGHSMGGQIAQWIAAAHPERVLGAVLLCPVPPSGLPLPDDARGLFQASPGNRELQKTILGLACKDLSASALERLLDDAGKIGAPCILQGLDAWTKGGFADKIGAIKAPTLVVATDDPFLPPEFLQKTIASLIPRAGLVYLPGPGHYVQVERSRETAALLRAYLTGLRP